MKYLNTFACSVITLSILFLGSCSNNTNTDTPAVSDTSKTKVTDTLTEVTILKPAAPKPAWGKDLTDPMAVIIEKLGSYKAPSLTTLSAQEARKQPTPADATMDVIKEHKITATASNADTMSKMIMVKGGEIPVRIYTPKTGKASYPVIVYYHGGGWVIANLDTYNASAEGLANQVDAIVISVAYRQGPEFKFPTAHNDSYAAYEWAVKNAASIKGDPKKIALVGESAGGNLAAAVSLMAKDKKLQMPVYEVLIYPIAGYDFTTPSYMASDSVKPLSSGLMKWFFKNYLTTAADGMNPMISLTKADLKGMPATTIISAQYDPLRSEGELLRDNLKKAGVETNYKIYNGVTHEFFGMAAVLPEAKDAQAVAAAALSAAFNK